MVGEKTSAGRMKVLEAQYIELLLILAYWIFIACTDNFLNLQVLNICIFAVYILSVV